VVYIIYDRAKLWYEKCRILCRWSVAPANQVPFCFANKSERIEKHHSRPTFNHDALRKETLSLPLCPAVASHVGLPRLTNLTRYIFPFLPRCSSGTASGAIPAPGSFADSALFGSPRKISEGSPRLFRAPPKKRRLALGAAASRCLVPSSHRGRKGEIRNVPQFSSDYRVDRQRPRTTPSAGPRFSPSTTACSPSFTSRSLKFRNFLLVIRLSHIVSTLPLRRFRHWPGALRRRFYFPRSPVRMRIDPSPSVSAARYFRRDSCSIVLRCLLNTSSLSRPSPLK
jgi:hypothetical protein